MKWIGISSFTTERVLRLLNRRGFSLTELAIVLGVGAVIVGGIWEIAAQSQESGRQQALKTNISIIVKNIQAYYAGTNGIPQGTTNGSLLTLTPFLLGLSPPIVPSDMLRPNGTGGCTTAPACADHPWGATTAITKTKGSLGVCAWNLAVTPAACSGSILQQQFFSIELQGVSLASCIKAAEINSGSNAPPGLYDVVINNASMLALGHGFPVLASDAQANCTASSTINFVYKIAPPQS